MMNPSQVLSYYHSLFGTLRLEDLKTKTALVTTDVSTGEKVLLEHGLVADAVFASGALWPLFPPLEVEGRLLMDGGYADPLPLLDLVKLDRSDINIAMMFDEKPDPNPQTFVQCLVNQVNGMLRTITRSQNILAVELETYETIFIKFVMQAPVGLDPAAVPLVLDAGRKMVKRHSNDILRAVHNFSQV
jgi:NTE family protein